MFSKFVIQQEAGQIMIHVKNNPQYYINARALTFSENDLGDPNRVAVSLVSGTVVMVHEKGTIDYASDGSYEKWTLRGYSTKLVKNDKYYIYARLSRADKTALIVFSSNSYNLDGSITTITGKDEEGNDITETTDPNENYFYVKIGELTETDGSSMRELTYDSGLLGTDKAKDESDGLSEMWELSKLSTPWLIRAKHWLADFTVKGFIKLVGGLKFSKGQEGDEKPITDIKRTVDSDNEFILDENGYARLDEDGNPIKDPKFVPVSDETIPTTAWVNKQTDGKYLSKQKDDRSVGTVASDKGFEVGQFTTGMIGGSGAKMYLDENGKSVLEIDKIAGREELIVPSITFNTIEIVSGDKANTFAYGRIKEVDVERRIATLDLLSDEYGTLKEYDILRGVFHDIKGGNDTETKEDSNGFLQYSGFFTAYFSPSEIIENEKGKMSFRYYIQDGTTKHPCAGMNFYAYGNFIYDDRQSVTYENRDYKRRLVKMNTWDIQPTKNIVMQDGKLDNLVIGGFKMSGYGTFQTNSYFTGTQIEFTPDQLENLKGEDAYSVTLSSYEGLLKVDAKGNITSGMTSTLNVVTGSMNVVTNDKNVVVTDFRLKTIIQAYRGNTPLFYSTSAGKGSFVASLRTVGCEGEITNGSVAITKITDLNNCRVTVTVNCEGKHPVDLDYHINAVYDGKAFNIETIYSKLQNPAQPEDIHPYEDNDQWSHEVSEENVFMAMATKENDEWTPWQVTRVKGFDGFDYKVYPESISIGRSLTGSLSPSSVLFTCYRVGAGERVEAKADWRIQRYDGTDWVDTDYSKTDVSAISYDFPSNAGYKSYRFIAIPREYDKVEAIGTATILEDGSNGQMARYRGVYKENEEYVWDDTYRDIVIYDGHAYQVKSYGDKVSGVFDTSRWNSANTFDFVAMNTALIDGANIAGFVFETDSTDANGNPVGVLRSQNGAIVLDSKNGTAKMSGDLFAKTLSFDGLSQDEEGNYVLPPINGRYGMMYVDNCIGISRSVQQKTYKTSGNDQIVRITGSSTVSNSTTTTINNQETIIFFSMYSDLIGNDVWTSVILPYWIYDGSGESVGGGKVVFSDGVPTKWDKDVLYVIE